MVIISKTKLVAFYELEPMAKEPLLAWYNLAKNNDWSKFSEIKQSYNSVDSVGNSRFVFNIGGNKYRLVAMIFFDKRTLFIKFIGTHKVYDNIDCKTI